MADRQGEIGEIGEIGTTPIDVAEPLPAGRPDEKRTRTD